jgi:hypothetical protein
MNIRRFDIYIYTERERGGEIINMLYMFHVLLACVIGGTPPVKFGIWQIRLHASLLSVGLQSFHKRAAGLALERGQEERGGWPQSDRFRQVYIYIIYEN